MHRRRLLILPVLIGAPLIASGAAAQQGGATCDASCEDNQCIFQGLNNVALGNAELSIDEQCRLVVGNIGGSGRDGVVQRGLQTQYMKTTLATPNFSGSRLGTRAEIRQLALVDGVPQETMLTRIVNFNGDEVRHSIDCSAIRIARYTIEIYDADVLVKRIDTINPPLMTSPKEDMLSMACGIWPNGDVYTVFRLAKPQPITFLDRQIEGGPFTGDVVFVAGFDPADVPTLQTDIENVFLATGPVVLAAMEAGPIPKDLRLPCGRECTPEAPVDK